MRLVKGDFQTLVENKDLVYLDSAATTLKPNMVVDRVARFLQLESANVHRGAHSLSDQATEYFEGARKTIAQFINANNENEVIFTKGTTESINLVASELSSLGLKKGDAILLSEMEHHSNIVPWQKVAERLSLEIRVIPVLKSGELDYSALETLINEKVKLTSLVHISNALGTINDLQSVVKKVKAVGSLVMIDAAQSVAVMSLDVQQMDVDFVAFSSHKIFGPFGVGILWGKEKLLNKMSPYQCGGSMIDRVTFKQTTYLPAPQRFEAGTPNISGVIGFAKAIEYLGQFELSDILTHEQGLVKKAHTGLTDLGGIEFLTPIEKTANVLSFNLVGAHHSDVGFILNKQNIAVRTGHHCAQPLMDALGIKGTVRASFSIYNNDQDVVRLIEGVAKAKELLL